MGSNIRDLEGGWRLSSGGEGGEEVGPETVHRHALTEEVDGSDVGAVGDVGDSSAAREQAGNPALTIDDTRAGVARIGEGSRLRVARQDNHLLRHRTRLALEIVPREGADGVKTPDGEAGGVAALHHHDDRVVLVVASVRVRFPHLFVRDEADELVETLSAKVEEKRVGRVGVPPRGEPVDADVDAEVHNVPDKVARVNLGRVDLDNSPVLGEPVVPDVESDRGGQNDVTNDSVLAVLPVTGGVREELLEDFDRPLRPLQLPVDPLPLHLSVLRFQLLSSLQPLLEQHDVHLPSADLGLNGR